MTPEKICYVLVYFAEAVIAWLYFEFLFTKRLKQTLLLAVIFALYAVLFYLSLLDSLAVNAVSFFVVNLTTIAFCYVCSIKGAILHAAFMTFVMIGAEIVVALLINTTVNDYSAYTYNFTVLVTLCVCSKLLYFLVLMISARVFTPHKEDNPDPHFLMLLCALPVSSMLVAATIVFVGMSYKLTNWLELLMGASVLSLLAVNIFVLITYNHVQRMNKENVELQLSAMKDAASLEYYSMLSQQYDNQRIMIHDINNHFGVLDTLSKDGDLVRVQQYLEQLMCMPEFKSKMRLCRNDILNMMLVRLSERCASNGVSFNCNIQTEKYTIIDVSSMTALFGNLFSNAFEAAISSEEKYIDFSINMNESASILVIAIENSCDLSPLQGANGVFLTHKTDKERHGLGTKSINRVVKKYNGTSKMYYHDEDRSFHCVINIPAK